MEESIFARENFQASQTFCLQLAVVARRSLDRPEELSEELLAREFDVVGNIVEEILRSLVVWRR